MDSEYDTQDVLQLYQARRIDAADNAAKLLIACVRNLLPEQSRGNNDSMRALCKQIVDDMLAVMEST